MSHAARGKHPARRPPPFLLALALLLLLPAMPPPSLAGGPDPRRDEALELTVDVAAADTDEQRIAALRKLAAYRHPDVAMALVQLAEETELSPAVLRELEWVLVAMGDFALKPLDDAVAARRVPVDLVTVVWKRVARQDPALLLAYTRSAIPLVARSAGLAVATCGHPDAAATVSRDFEQAAAGARIAYLQATCLVDARRCLELLDAARKAPETAVRAAALTLGPPEGRRVPAESLAVCLHDKDPNVVRAALEALTDGPVAGIEKDLEILAQGGPDDIREQALRTLARAGTRPAAAALARIVKQFPDSTAIGHLARELYKEGLGEVVLMGNAAGAIPVSATLTSEPDGRLAFRLYNDEGFRVVVRGALYLKCQGLPQTRTDVNVQDFEADGTLRLEVRCRRGGPPEVQWKRRDGHRFRASITDF